MKNCVWKFTMCAVFLVLIWDSSKPNKQKENVADIKPYNKRKTLNTF